MENMPSPRAAAFAVSLILCLTGGAAFADNIRITDLRCEHLNNPAGIDAVRPRLSWKMEDPDATRGQRQQAFQILVASSPDLLEKNRGDLWDSGKVDSDQSVLVSYAGAALDSRQACWWKVRAWDKDGRESAWSEPASWTMGLLHPGDWHAQWISTPKGTGQDKSEPWFRKTFTLPKLPVRAVAYVASIGYHELYVNGRKVSDAVLTPSVVNYRKRVRYLTYDITSLLHEGANCIGLWLGSGWSTLNTYQLKDGAMVLAQIEVDLPGGDNRRLVTDDTWKTHDSPVSVFGSSNPGRYGGEQYDATLDQPGWCRPDFDDTGWDSAKTFPPQPQILSAEMIESNRLLDVIKPVSIGRAADGAVRMDFGKAFTGWLDLPVHGASGQKVSIEYSERDNEDCTFKQRDFYVCAGREGERFQNHFNYRAFRWVTVRGLDELPSANDITGHLVRTAYRMAGDFECSDPLLNRIYQACQWTFQCLTINGYTVDCPHRERLGYGGDAHATCETGLSQFETGAFYTKWLMDWRDCQEPSGEMPHTAPQYMGGGGPGWGGICVVLPWELYLREGDSGILETSYPSIQKWLAFLESKSKDNLLRHFTAFGISGNEKSKWSFLGDWVAPGRGQQPGQRVDDNTVLFFNNCYWLLNLDLAARIADVLGHREDAARYRDRRDEVRRAVHGQFFNAANNSYANGEQPYLVFPLIVGVTPPELRSRVQEQLVHTILETDRGHINSGMHGCWLLFNFLMENDRNDLIATMVGQISYPGWGSMISQGATTIWEEWNGNNSRLHSTLLAVGNWFTEGIAGIRPDPTQPGYKRFLVQPAPVGGLTWARASHESPYGLIRSGWRMENGIFTLDLQVPPNSSALVSLPTRNAASVREHGQPADKSPGVRFLHQEKNRAVFECPAGCYTFTGDVQ